MADVLEAEDSGEKIQAYCDKHSMNPDVIKNVLETAQGIWPHELLAETGQLP
ncbi:hypothetical protein D3C86_1923200 [compost metagenome]